MSEENLIFAKEVLRVSAKARIKEEKMNNSLFQMSSKEGGDLSSGRGSLTVRE
jgi:hypothetical protein